MAVDYAALKKGGFMRQKQKGYFSLRIKVVGGHLNAEQIKKIYEVAEKYGEGYVHLTSRQSVEIPFIHEDNVEMVKEELAKGGCLPSSCGPRVRTVTACQGNTVCPSGCVDTYGLAVELDKRYFGKELPHKFKFGVTGCQNNCLKAEENDVGIKGGLEVTWDKEKCIFCGICEKVCRSGAIKIEEDNILLDHSKCNYCGRCMKACPTDAWVGEEGYIFSFGGLFGNQINKGTEVLPIVKDKEQLFRITDAAVEFFAKYGKSGERFKFTIDRIGWDIFQKEMEDAYHGTV